MDHLGHSSTDRGSPNDVGNRIHSVVYMPSSRPYTERTLAQRWQESSE